MKLSAKVMVPALALLSTAAIGQTVSAYTWVGGEPDPNTVYDSVQKQDNATIPAEGTFKEWDPTDRDQDQNQLIQWIGSMYRFRQKCYSDKQMQQKERS